MDNIIEEKLTPAEKIELENLKSNPLIYGKKPIGEAFGAEAIAMKEKDTKMRTRINELESKQALADVQTQKSDKEKGDEYKKWSKEFDSKAQAKRNVSDLSGIINKEFSSTMYSKAQPEKLTLEGKTPAQIRAIVIKDSTDFANAKTESYNKYVKQLETNPNFVSLDKNIHGLHKDDKLQFDPFQSIGEKPASGGQKIGQTTREYELSRVKAIEDADKKKWEEEYGPNSKKRRRV